MTLATGLDATATAAGVERDNQRGALTQLGYTTGQGPMFGGALPASNVLTMLQRGYNGTPGILAQPLTTTSTTEPVHTGHRLRGIRLGLTH